jgi:hypothetical protein
MLPSLSIVPSRVFDSGSHCNAKRPAAGALYPIDPAVLATISLTPSHQEVERTEHTIAWLRHALFLYALYLGLGPAPSFW